MDVGKQIGTEHGINQKSNKPTDVECPALCDFCRSEKKTKTKT